MKKFLLLFLLLPFLGFSQVIPAGDYVIKSANDDAFPNFKNLTTAITYLNTHGIGGNVRFLLDNDQTAISQITINAFTNSGNNTVTIKPNVDKNIKITVNKLNASSGVPAVFLFNGTKNIIIDGSNSNLETKNLELINNDDLSYLNRSIIWIASNSNIPSSNITIKNSTLRFINRTQQNNLLAGVYSGNNGIGVNNTISIATSTASNSNITIKNNEFVNVKEGVNIYGDSNSSIRPVNWNIQKNKITGGVADVDKLSRGIYVSNSTNFTILNNSISGVLRNSNSGSVLTTATNQTAGICVLGESSGTIDSNIIDDVRNVNYASDGDIGGIFINVNTGVTLNVSNNIISKVYSGATDSNDYNYHYKGYGIYVKSGGTTNLYFNTVVLNHSGAGGLTSCLYLEGGTLFNIRNNIFYNSQPGIQYGIFIRNIAASNINNISNNAYYVTNSSGNFSNRLSNTSYIGNPGTTTTGFLGWKAILGNKDAGSILQSPSFVSATDLHLNVTGNDALKAGTSISGITTDVDLETRDLVKPYIGADEIVCRLPNPEVLVLDPICPAPGKASIKNYNPQNTYTFSPSGPKVGVDGEILDLTPGELYTVKSNTKNCLSLESAAFSLKSSTAIFTNRDWSVPPTPNLSAEIRTNYTTGTEGLNVCSLKVTSGAVTVASGSFIQVQNNIDVLSGGSLTVESDGNLIQLNDDAINTGDIQARRTVQPRRNGDLANTYSAKEYSFYSSPVSGQNMKAIFGGSSANSAFALVLNEPANNFVNASQAHYAVKGKGFAVKDPTVAYVNSLGGSKIVTATFTGKPNNGKIEVPVTRTGNLGWNLIGNPYPSAYDLKELYADNAAIMDATIRFWDKNVNNTYTQFGSAYNGYSYAIYNASSNMGNSAPGGDAGENTGTIGSTPDKKEQYRYAKVGQGFIVRSLLPSGNIIFRNNRRVESKVGVFFGKASEEETRDIFRIQLISPDSLAMTQSIVYYEGGGNSFGVEDSKHPAISSSDTFYSFAGTDKVVINGRAMFDHTDVLRLGSRHFNPGNYKIRAKDFSGVFSNGQAVYLKDKDLGIITNLTESEYSFASLSGEFSNRFEIIYKPGSVLATGDSFKTTVEVYRDGADFVVNSQHAEIAKVEVIDMAGRLIYSADVRSTQVHIKADILVNGIYLVKTSLKNGSVQTKLIRN